MEDFKWNDLLVAEFAGRASWINDPAGVPILLEVFKKEKAKPTILFRTEDGVEYSNRNDKVWSVCPNGTWETLNHKVHYAMSFKAWKHFSTKEAMDDFIIMNRPLLSLSEILNVWDDGIEKKDPNYYKEARLFSRFEKVVKSKLFK